MQISIISASHRKKSQSQRVANIIISIISEIDNNVKTHNLCLANSGVSLWTQEKNNKNSAWKNSWLKTSNSLQKSLGYILVVPEYGGMATPQAKNFFLLCSNGELAHKPGLIVSVSSGNGGAYPISELRSSSYKNTHIMWIPENIIIRNVEEFRPGNHGDSIPEWIDDRIEYVLKLFLVYASSMKPLREIINRKDFGNGM